MSEASQHLKVIAMGLSATEKRLLAATAKLSQKREVVIDLVSSVNIVDADVVIVDGKDEEAMSWANTNADVLKDKPVAWVDEKSQSPMHSELKRPVLWVNLPVLISQVMDEASVYAATHAAKTSSASTPAPAKVETQPDQQSQPASAGGANPVAGGLEILIVDDSPAIRLHLSNLLESDGYQVTQADSGEAALGKMSNKYFNCIFMDVLMPGMDGYEACKKIKAKKVDGKIMPVIMLTGKSSPFDKIRGKMAGCDAYLTKPVAVEKLRNTLKHVAI